jgi:V8-like Glu-specific endopeptidase
MCSGTLIAPSVILTAAHCVTPEEPDKTFANYQAQFGTVFSLGAPQTYKVISTAAHPKYSSETKDYDVAVMLLDREVKGVPLLPVAKSIPSLVGRALTHVGWGFTSPDGQGWGTKRSASIPVKQQLSHQLTSGNGGTSSDCRGDSGGPALLASNGAEVVVGIASTGTKDCNGDMQSFRPDAAADFIAKFAPNALEDLAGGAQPPPPAPNGPPGAPGGQPGQSGQSMVCQGNACYQCPDRAASDRCGRSDCSACSPAPTGKPGPGQHVCLCVGNTCYTCPD